MQLTQLTQVRLQINQNNIHKKPEVTDTPEKLKTWVAEELKELQQKVPLIPKGVIDELKTSLHELVNKSLVKKNASLQQDEEVPLTKQGALKGIVLNKFPTDIENAIVTFLEEASRQLKQLYIAKNIPLGQSYKNGLLKSITPQEEAKIRQWELIKQTGIEWIDTAILVITLAYTLLFNADRMISHTSDLGKEYAEDPSILRQATFTEFDLFILSVLYLLSVGIKTMLLSGHSSSILSSNNHSLLTDTRLDLLNQEFGLKGNPDKNQSGAIINSDKGVLIFNHIDRKQIDLIRTGITTGEFPTNFDPYFQFLLLLIIFSPQESPLLESFIGDGRLKRFSCPQEIASSKKNLNIQDVPQKDQQTIKNNQDTQNKYSKIGFYEKFLNGSATVEEIKKTIEDFKKQDPFFLLIGIDDLIQEGLAYIHTKFKEEKPIFIMIEAPQYGIAKSTLAQAFLAYIKKNAPAAYNKQTIFQKTFENGSIQLSSIDDDNRTDEKSCKDKLQIRKWTDTLLKCTWVANMILHAYLLEEVTRFYDKTQSTQEVSDNTHFAYIMYLAWCTLYSVGFFVANKTNETYSKEPVKISSHSDVTFDALDTKGTVLGVPSSKKGSPHQKVDYTSLKTLANRIFIENWDTVPKYIREALVKMIQNQTFYFGEEGNHYQKMPISPQTLVSTTNHFDTSDVHDFWKIIPFPFKAIPSTSKEDFEKHKELVFALIISLTPSGITWDKNAIQEFMHKLYDEKKGGWCLRRQTLADVIQKAARCASYEDSSTITKNMLQGAWKQCGEPSKAEFNNNSALK